MFRIIIIMSFLSVTACGGGGGQSSSDQLTIQAANTSDEAALDIMAKYGSAIGSYHLLTGEMHDVGPLETSAGSPAENIGENCEVIIDESENRVHTSLVSGSGGNCLIQFSSEMVKQQNGNVISGSTSSRYSVDPSLAEHSPILSHVCTATISGSQNSATEEMTMQVKMQCQTTTVANGTFQLVLIMDMQFNNDGTVMHQRGSIAREAKVMNFDIKIDTSNPDSMNISINGKTIDEAAANTGWLDSISAF